MLNFEKAVLVFVVQAGMVMLAEKRHKIGQGMLNGYGGKPKPGESMREAACREFWEETGGAAINPLDLHQAALVKFRNEYPNGRRILWTIYVYTVPRFVGKVLSTREMGEPEWHSIARLPCTRLLPADRYWLPQALSGKQLYVTGGYGVGLTSLASDVEVKETVFRLEW